MSDYLGKASGQASVLESPLVAILQDSEAEDLCWPLFLVLKKTKHLLLLCAKIQVVFIILTIY